MEKIQTKICTLIRPDFIKGYEASRSEMDRWTGIPKAAETAERIFRETHAISAMTSSTKGYEKKRLETEHWTEAT